MESPRVPYDTSKTSYSQTISDLDKDEDYITKHQLIHDDTGEIIDEITPVQKKIGDKFGVANKNTVRPEQGVGYLSAEWFIDDLPENERPRSLVVCNIYVNYLMFNKQTLNFTQNFIKNRCFCNPPRSAAFANDRMRS